MGASRPRKHLDALRHEAANGLSTEATARPCYNGDVARHAQGHPGLPLAGWRVVRAVLEADAEHEGRSRLPVHIDVQGARHPALKRLLHHKVEHLGAGHLVPVYRALD